MGENKLKAFIDPDVFLYRKQSLVLRFVNIGLLGVT